MKSPLPSPPSYISTMTDDCFIDNDDSSQEELNRKVNMTVIETAKLLIESGENNVSTKTLMVVKEKKKVCKKTVKSPRSRIGSANDAIAKPRRSLEDIATSSSNSHLLSVPSAPTIQNQLTTNSSSSVDSIVSASRDIYSITMEINLNKSLPRWPVECQVLAEKIRHIRSIPRVAEIFYEVTGKEPQPRPLGDEHGVLIFDYQPNKAANYFSRSIAAPASDSPKEFNSDLPILPDTLKFESRFESGNLMRVTRITESYYELKLRPDLYTQRHCQWFYFRVTNMKSDLSYRFSIVNMSKPDSLYTCGMKPVLYSMNEADKHGVGWTRVGNNIRYYRNDNCDDDENCTYTLTFNVNFPHDNDTVYLAHCYPYTYSDLQEDLHAMTSCEFRSQFFSQRLLCKTLAGNNVYLLTVTSPGTQEELKRKEMVVFSARVHPGETPSSWIMRGILNFLTGDSEVAAELRNRFIFKIVPMLNPDGCIVGNTRCSLAGRDLNRQYKSVVKEAFPPVYHFKTMMKRLMEECGVLFYCDFHAHSRRFNTFMYGCENRRHSEKFLREQVFPLMLHKNTSEKFSFDDCRFKIQRQKESTGRVVFWNMGILCSYTLEASYGGTNMGSRAYTHFNTADYEGMGRYFCETLLDFHDPSPGNEQLRSKIVQKLIKEGSSADEPSNIALTDYSSLSSDDLSVLSSPEDDHNLPETSSDTNMLKHRKLRKSRRERSRLTQHHISKSATFASFSPNLPGLGKFTSMNKSDSDKIIEKVVSAKNGKISAKAKSRKKFKRSTTMATIPSILLAKAEEESRTCRKEEIERCQSPRVQVLKLTEENTTFTIGTSDESDEDPDNTEQLKILYGGQSPIEGPEKQQLSASSCRRVHSEIMADISKIKCSWLRTKGLLQNNMSTSMMSLNRIAADDGDSETSVQESNRILTPSRTTRNPSKNTTDKEKASTKAISINVPTKSEDFVNGSEDASNNSRSRKNWEKCSGKVRKSKFSQSTAKSKGTSVETSGTSGDPEAKNQKTTAKLPRSLSAVARLEMVKQRKKKKSVKKS